MINPELLEPNNTLVALMEAVFDRLTAEPGPIQWAIDSGAVQTLPPRAGSLVLGTNVLQKYIWNVGGTPPMPLIAYQCESHGQKSRQIFGEQELTIKLWVASKGQGPREAAQIYKVVRARLNFADQDSPWKDLSRAPTGTKLGLTVRLCREDRALPPMFNPETSRWYVPAEYSVTAI